MIELKPCPFCGGEARLHAIAGSGGGIQVKCMDCYAQTEPEADLCLANCQKHNATEKAIKTWNRRFKPRSIGKWVYAGDELPEPKKWVLVFIVWENGRTSPVFKGWYDKVHQKWEGENYIAQDAEVFWTQIPAIPEIPEFTREDKE